MRLFRNACPTPTAVEQTVRRGTAHRRLPERTMTPLAIARVERSVAGEPVRVEVEVHETLREGP